MTKHLVSKWGYNGDVDVFGGADVDLITEDTLQYWAAVAVPIEVNSTSVNDTEGGTGARSVRLQGLSADFRLISEDIDMNGTSTVTTKQSFYRVNRAHVLTAGSLETNDGLITFSDGTGTMAVIGAGVAQTEKATYTVPDVPNPYISAAQLKLQKKTSNWVTGLILTRSDGTGVWRTRGRLIASEASPDSDSLVVIGLSVGDDVRICCVDASADSLEVTGGFTIRYN